ncbi:sensor histidine kinase [Actinosynnema sp.]|uniref:sensor histidine kinase n=1 Tax=Actinosynnema sp. TaxID=1872144 RepID=UPI003F855CF4
MTGRARPAPGQVEGDVLDVVARVAGPVRGVGLVLLSSFGVLSVPDARLPLAFALFGLVLLGAVVDCWSAVTGRGAALAFVFAVARAGAVCATQDPSSQWALNVLTTTAITLQWEWSPKVTVPATAALLAVYLVGGEGGGAAVLRVVVECVLARLAFELLRRSTGRVDRLRAERAALERAEALAVQRRRQEREYLALLHDTASATFLVVAVHGGDPDEVAGYARRDLAVLTAPGGGEAGGVVDVGSSLRALVERGPVRFDTRFEDALVPTGVALALVRAVREAVVNVERHAGVESAELVVRARGSGGVLVEVRDHGRGFDPGAVPGHRRGIRGSLVERMAAVGGRAEVRSRPGAGTLVRLTWDGEDTRG